MSSEPVGTGRVHESSGTKYIYLNADAAHALGVDGDTEVSVFRIDDGLRVVPEGVSPPRTVECRHCEKYVRDDEIWDHHVDRHPNQRFDPAWYAEPGGDNA